MGGSLNSRKNRFEGKVAVITGGGGVLCSAVAEALAKEGASIAILDIREDAAETVASKIRAEGGKALAVKADVTDRTSVEEACKTTLELQRALSFLSSIFLRRRWNALCI